MSLPSDPNVETFLLRFPEFSSSDSSVIGFALEEAGLIIGTWSAKGRTLAYLYLAAHIMATQNIAAANDGREIRHESLGRIAITYRQSDSSGNSQSYDDLSSTFYGRRYMRLKALEIKPLQMLGTPRSSQFRDFLF